MKLKRHILAVDDNAGVRTALELLLSRRFDRVTTIADPSQLSHILASDPPDVVLLDMNFKSAVNNGNEGLYWLSEIKRRNDTVPIILMTAYADIELAVRGIKQGAADFVVKPWDNDRLISTIESLLTFRRHTPQASADGMDWGVTDSMHALRAFVEKVAPTDANILITGENGTGKEVLAKEIHRISRRSRQSMLTVDMGSLSESLFESELFGHVRGAFTGALADRRGKLEEASQGTLFMDEIANLPVHLQSKLLTALQSRKITPIGSNKLIDIDIRLICATNADIDSYVAEGRFREDLLYRINTIRISLPPLRERREDIPVLAGRFLREYAALYNRPVETISPEALQILTAHPWPGNVRELRHSVEKAVIVGEGSMLRPEDFTLTPSRPQTLSQSPADLTLADMEKNMIRSAIHDCQGNLSAAATRLGISRQTLYNKMKRYGI